MALTRSSQGLLERWTTTVTTVQPNYGDDDRVGDEDVDDDGDDNCSPRKKTRLF